MKELMLRVTVTGDLVKNAIEEFTTKKGVEAIGGSLVLRTSDGSEHEIDFYSNKYKKDQDGNFTNEENYFYKEYLKAKTELKDLESCQEGELPDVISITDGVFTANDFKGRDGEVVTTNKIFAKFINKVDNRDLDTTPKIAKFEVEGIIESIKDEIRRDEVTGNLIITLNAIRQFQTDYKDKNSFEVDSLVPIRLTVDKSIAPMFKEAGYYDGCWAKFIGELVNTTETEEIVEKQAFGEDNVRVVKRTIKKYDVKSGSAPSTIFEHDLTQEVVDALIAKRKQSLVEIKNEVVERTNTQQQATTPAPNPTYNPFAQ